MVPRVDQSRTTVSIELRKKQKESDGGEVGNLGWAHARCCVVTNLRVTSAHVHLLTVKPGARADGAPPLSASSRPAGSPSRSSLKVKLKKNKKKNSSLRRHFLFDPAGFTFLSAARGHSTTVF